MSLHPLVGHRGAQAEVAKAVVADRLPQLLVLVGPEGVGKQRFGLWLAQLLLCEHPGSEPCGACRGCRDVLALVHPDLHWLMPVARPKAGEPDKQVEELAETIGETVAARRANPLYTPEAGLTGHFMATARLLLRRAAMTPAQAKRKVFLVAEADRLVPQEANPEAANALLKLFEEPPSDTQFILTVEDANLLLPTVRSRAVMLRLKRLKNEEVKQFLEQELEPRPAAGDLAAMVARGQGSIGRALAEGEDAARARREAEEVLSAIREGGTTRLDRALRQPPWQARGDFTGLLDALAELLGEAARKEAVGTEKGLSGIVRAREKVLEARELAQGNVNPQLLLAVLQEDLAEAL